MKTLFVKTIGAGLLVLGSAILVLISESTLAAGPLPIAGDTPYRATGVVEYINLEKNTVVISDRGMSLRADVPVHARNRMASPYALRKGMQVGYNATEQPGTRPAISEIWVISGR